MSKLESFLRSDGAGLIILGAASIANGVSFLPVDLWAYTGGNHPAERWLPLNTWAIVWLVAGIAAFIIGVGWRDTKAAAIAWGTCLGLHTLWGISFITEDIFGDTTRGWVSSKGYFAVVLLSLWAVWRGNMHEVRITKER